MSGTVMLKAVISITASTKAYVKPSYTQAGDECKRSFLVKSYMQAWRAQGVLA